MAVPKKKTSKSRRNLRRSHHALSAVNVIMDGVTGEYRLPHQISKVDGSYRGRQVVVRKAEDDNDAE